MQKIISFSELVYHRTLSAGTNNWKSRLGESTQRYDLFVKQLNVKSDILVSVTGVTGVTGDSMMWKPASGFLISTILLLLFLF